MEPSKCNCIVGRKGVENSENCPVHKNSFGQQEFKIDTVVQSIVEKFNERAKKGKIKYGTDLDRKDLTLSEWLEHAIQEHMDSILYLQKIKKLIEEKNLDFKEE